MAGDLVFHLLADAQRALVAFGTLAGAGVTPDTDARASGPAGASGSAADTEEAERAERAGRAERAERHRRNTRIMASVWSSLRPLADLDTETARAGGAGRRPLTDEERSALRSDAARFPLFG